MKTTLRLAVAAALVMAAPAMAQTFLQPQPMGAKYRDQGAKPATGRSGSASIEARALLDVDGNTDIEVTTGRFEGIGGGGSLAKVQLKLFRDGILFATDNYKEARGGPGTGTYSYDGLMRGQVAQVQASVTGIDPNRTDIVTVATEVKRRPDIEVASVEAPARVNLNAPVAIRGVVSEINGDVGARATCRLLADGLEIGAIPGAWVDADSTVTCEFNVSFASVGTRNLTVRVTDLEPRDYDASNNEASAAIDVVSPVNVRYIQAIVTHRDEVTTWDETARGPDWGYEQHKSSDVHLQQTIAETVRLGQFPFDGRITFRQSSGGVALPSLSVAVQDLPQASGTCRRGFVSSGERVSYCSFASGLTGLTTVDVRRSSGLAVYVFDVHTYSPYDEQFVHQIMLEGPGGTPYPLGEDYTVEIQHETAQGTFGGTVTIPLQTQTVDVDEPFACWFNPIFGGFEMCRGSSTHARFLNGRGMAFGS